MASNDAQRLIVLFSEFGDEFTPHLVVEMLRSKAREADDGTTEIICDLIEGLWDEVQRLRYLLDQSKGGLR